MPLPCLLYTSILGESTYLAEIELVLATTTLLGKLDFHNFTIRINDRKILKAMAQYSGFPQESFDTVFIILDKMDKIGLEGVAEELEKEGFAKESIDTYLGLFKEITSDIEGVRYCKEKLKDVLDPQVAEDLETIISTVDSVKTADFKMSFDPTLVRGMSYYTGPIFETVSYTHLDVYKRQSLVYRSHIIFINHLYRFVKKANFPAKQYL